MNYLNILYHKYFDLIKNLKDINYNDDIIRWILYKYDNNQITYENIFNNIIDLYNIDNKLICNKTEVIIDDTIYCGNLFCNENIIIPDNFKINGNLILSYCNITKLPDNLYVNGNIYANNNNISYLQNNIKINGFIDLTNNPLIEINNNDFENILLDKKFEQHNFLFSNEINKNSVYYI